MTVDELIEQLTAMQGDGHGGARIVVRTLDENEDEQEADLTTGAIDSRRPGVVFLLGF